MNYKLINRLIVWVILMLASTPIVLPFSIISNTWRLGWVIALLIGGYLLIKDLSGLSELLRDKKSALVVNGLMIWFWAITLSLVFSKYISEGVDVWFKYGMLILILVIILFLDHRKKIDFELLGNSLVLVGIAGSLVSLLVKLFPSQMFEIIRVVYEKGSFEFMLFEYVENQRILMFFPVYLLLPYYLYIGVRGSKKWLERGLGLVAFFLSFIAVYLSNWRILLIVAFGASILMACFLKEDLGKKKYLLITPVVFGLFLLFFWIRGVSGDVFSRFSPESVSGVNNVYVRLYYWSEGISMWQKSPVFGSGVGVFEYLADSQEGFLSQIKSGSLARYSRLKISSSMGHAHNWFINTLAEQGVIGLFALAWMLWIFFKDEFRRIKSKNLKIISLILCSFIFVGVNQVDAVMFMESILIFMVLRLVIKNAD